MTYNDTDRDFNAELGFYKGLRQTKKVDRTAKVATYYCSLMFC